MTTMPTPATTAPAPDPLEATTLKEILNISDDVLDHAMGTAYQLYRAGRLSEAEIVCKGLLACDHRYWWSYSLYAAVLRRLGRDEEALVHVERGLTYEPGQPKLLMVRDELRTTLARKRAPLAGSALQRATPDPRMSPTAGR
jgi:hypothetical protein